MSGVSRYGAVCFCLCSVCVVYTLRNCVPVFFFLGRGSACLLLVDSLVGGSVSRCLALKHLPQLSALTGVRLYEKIAVGEQRAAPLLV